MDCSSTMSVSSAGISSAVSFSSGSSVIVFCPVIVLHPANCTESSATTQLFEQTAFEATISDYCNLKDTDHESNNYGFTGGRYRPRSDFAGSVDSQRHRGTLRARFYVSGSIVWRLRYRPHACLAGRRDN